MTYFVRLIILIKLIIENFILFIIPIVVVFALATQSNFQYNSFKENCLFNVKFIFYEKELIF